MNIPFLDLSKESELIIEKGLMTDIEKTIRSGQFLFGSNHERLEEELSYRLGYPAVLVGSGTDAIALSLIALGIGPGCKVAVPGLSAIPTAVAVKMTGARPIYVDVDSTATMSYRYLERLLMKQTIDAVVPVHLYGNLANTSGISSLCEDYGIPMVEDCAQSFGAGEGLFFGSTKTFSFYPTKNLACMGDGGCVLAKNKLLADEIRELRFYGQKSKFALGRRHGMNSRMDEIQCAVLLKKLEMVDEYIFWRRETRELYNRKFGYRSIAWSQRSVPHIYPLIAPEEFGRNLYIKALNKKGIETAIHYQFHLGEAVDGVPGKYALSNAYSIAERIFSIPFNPWMTSEQVNYVIDSVVKIEEELQ